MKAQWSGSRLSSETVTEIFLLYLPGFGLADHVRHSMTERHVIMVGR